VSEIVQSNFGRAQALYRSGRSCIFDRDHDRPDRGTMTVPIARSRINASALRSWTKQNPSIVGRYGL
jgi:hypothetical protein